MDRTQIRRCSLTSFYLALFLSILSACGGGGGGNATVPPPTLSALSVTIGSASFPLGTTQQLLATGTYSNGSTQNLSTAVTWTSSTPSVATVNASGLVTSVSQGTATITATSGSVSTVTTVTVGAPVLKSISISPNNSSVALGLRQQFAATGTLTDGTTQTLTSVTWASSAVAVATIDTGGLLTTKLTGNLSVTATSGTITGTTAFTVTPATIVSMVVSPQNGSVAAGLTKQLTATATYTDGTTQDLATANWSSSDTSLAAVSSSGLVTSKKQGDVVITAASAAVSSSAPFHIDPPALTSIKVTPPSVSVLLGTSAPPQYTAIGTYTDQSTADLSASVTWSASAPDIVSVDASGKATPTWHGYSEITAASGTVVSNNVRFVGLAYPRYLFSVSDQGQIVQRATVDNSNGRVRWEGRTDLKAFVNAPGCTTTDPKEGFLYATSAKDANTGVIDIQAIDHVKGVLAEVSGPSGLQVSAPVNCLQFEPGGNFAYATASYNNTNNQLLTFQRGALGNLTQINSISLPTAPSVVAMDPLGKYLYLTTEYLGTGTQALAYGYTIDPVTGGLTPIPGTPFQLSISSGAFAYAPTGRFLYLSDSATSISVHSVDRKTGKITLASALQTCVNISQLLFSPSGDNAYATCTSDVNLTPNSASVESFGVNADGSLIHLGSAPWDSGVGRLSMDTSGKYLYVNAYGNHLMNYVIDSGGLATLDRRMGVQVNSANIVIVSGAAPVTYTPKNVFVSSTGDNRISSFVANADGTLGTSRSVISQPSPFSLSMVPWGNQLLADSLSATNTIVPYTVAQDGTLTPGLAFGESQPGASLVMDPSGTEAFDIDSAHSGIYTYTGSSGFWGVIAYQPQGQPLLEMFPTGNTPGPVAVDSVGRLVFVGNRGGKSITAFHHWGTGVELFESNGQWTVPYADGSPYTLGAVPIALAVDPTGAWLYVACDDQTLRVFSIDYAASGHLKQVASKTLISAPTSISVDVNSRFLYVTYAGGLYAFAVNYATGGLTDIALGPEGAIANANAVYADPTGKYLYVTSSAPGTGSVLGFEIQTDGTLKGFSQNPLATPNQPSSMTFAADIQ